MNNEMKVFSNERFGKIRTVVQNGEPWFVATDVCRALEVGDTGKATGRLDDDELTRIKIVSGGQSREVIVVSEAGLYGLVLGSRKPEAKEFKRWVTHEVIPSIRKTGGYLGNVENMSDIEILGRAMMIYKRTVEEQHKQIEEMKPKAEFADRVIKSTDNILMRQMAKLLCDKGYLIGEKRLYQLLRDQKILMKNNEPYQQYVDKGYFVVQEGTYTTPDDKQRLYHTTKVTPVGQIWLIEKVIPRLKIA